MHSATRGARRAHVSCSTSAACRSPHSSDGLAHSPAVRAWYQQWRGPLFGKGADCQTHTAEYTNVQCLDGATFLVELYRALHKSLTWPMINNMAQLQECKLHVDVAAENNQAKTFRP